jgi:hypothetical protein
MAEEAQQGDEGKKEVSHMMLMLIQEGANEPQQIQIAQETVIAIIAASTIIVIGLLWLIGRFASSASRTPDDPGPLYYGNFFVVIFGLMTALIGFLIAFPLVVSNVFSDPTQVIALLSALFGTIVGLVGTYFGIKSSSDAARGAQDIAERATPGNNGPGGGPRSGATNEKPNRAASGTPIKTATAPTGGTTTEGVTRRSPAAGSTTDPEAPSQEDSERNR